MCTCAHAVATVVGPSPNGPQFCHIGYICPGGATPVDHESAQLSRLEAVVDASPKPRESPNNTPMSLQPQTPAQPTQPTSLVFCLLASVEGTTACLGIPLQSPPPGGRGETVTWRPPPPPPPGGGDRHALWGEISRGGGYVSVTTCVSLRNFAKTRMYLLLILATTQVCPRKMLQGCKCVVVKFRKDTICVVVYTLVCRCEISQGQAYIRVSRCVCKDA